MAAMIAIGAYMNAYHRPGRKRFSPNSGRPSTTTSIPAAATT